MDLAKKFHSSYARMFVRNFLDVFNIPTTAPDAEVIRLTVNDVEGARAVSDLTKPNHRSEFVGQLNNASQILSNSSSEQAYSLLTTVSANIAGLRATSDDLNTRQEELLKVFRNLFQPPPYQEIIAAVENKPRSQIENMFASFEKGLSDFRKSVTAYITNSDANDKRLRTETRTIVQNTQNITGEIVVQPSKATPALD